MTTIPFANAIPGTNNHLGADLAGQQIFNFIQNAPSGNYIPKREDNVTRDNIDANFFIFPVIYKIPRI